MPIVAHSNLPTFLKMLKNSENVLSKERALSQDIRELHIGFLNMMPDAAFEATERQFFSLIAACNQIAQFYIHPFTFPEIERSAKTQAYIDQYYEKFENLQNEGLDALIITGANPQTEHLHTESFWQPLQKTLDWARQKVPSTLCACLATHAAVLHFHNLQRRKLAKKRWGVFSHRVVDASHPLVKNINTRFDVPHSRWNEISRTQLENVGAKVLVESQKGGVHLAVSPDGFRNVYFQAHPEYDINSLLKEYKREVKRYLDGDRAEYPPFPVHYFGEHAKTLAKTFKEQALITRNPDLLADFPELEIATDIDNTWNDTGKVIISNWLGLVYQLTNADRRLIFMTGIDPDNPLAGLNQR